MKFWRPCIGNKASLGLAMSTLGLNPDGKIADLNGLTIVITRPRAQATASAAWFESFGARVMTFPVLEIEPLPDAIIDEHFSPRDLSAANAIIFVSANAAEHGVTAIDRRGGFPRGAAIFAIGSATATRLQDYGLVNIQSPAHGNDSEALLALPQLQNVQGQKIVIVRGISESGGRTHLKQTLRTRGASVSMLECYVRRSILAGDALRAELKAALKDRKIHAFSVLSVETLQSLVLNLTDANMAEGLSECMILVPHPRVAEAAREIGFTRVSVVPMGGEPLHAALLSLKPALLDLTNRT
jgi:uroporphyrinogen-III synthase